MGEFQRLAGTRSLQVFFFFLMIRRPPSSPLFPYRPLFRPPATPAAEVRATLGLESLIAPPTAGGSDEPLPITRDADLEMLVHLYRTLPERQRRTLVAVVRATAGSLGEVAPAPAEISHTGSERVTPPAEGT